MVTNITIGDIRTINLKYKEVRNNLVYSKGEEIPYTGKFVSQELEEEYTDGIKDGVFKESFLDKNINYTYEGRYIKGVRHGKWIVRYPSGNKKASIEYNYGRPCGKWIYFFESKKLKGYDHFKNGVLDGEVACFDNNGNKEISANYKNGVLNGQTIVYKDSKIKAISFFKDGKLDGKLKVFSSGSRIILDGDYKEDNREGEWKIFYQSGELKTIVTYLGGKKNGRTLVYDKGGTLIEELHFKDGCLIDVKNNRKEDYIIKDNIIEFFKEFNRNLEYVKYL